MESAELTGNHSLSEEGLSATNADLGAKLKQLLFNVKRHGLAPFFSPMALIKPEELVMLEVKPLSNTDYFVYPMQSCKAVDRRSVPNVIRGVVVTISTTGQGLSKPEQRKNLMRADLLKEKVKKILAQKIYIVEGLNEFSDSIKSDTE